MKINSKNYLVSLHLPGQINSAATDTEAWPAHRRVRASTATRAIRIVHRELVNEWNLKLDSDALFGDVKEAVDAYLASVNRPEFKPQDFPIMEVKVVA